MLKCFCEACQLVNSSIETLMDPYNLLGSQPSECYRDTLGLSENGKILSCKSEARRDSRGFRKDALNLPDDPFFS